MARRVQQQDIGIEVITGDNIAAHTITAQDIKLIGGADNISAATLSYNGVTNSPTIKSVVDGILSQNDGVTQDFTTAGFNSFSLTYTVNTASPYLIFFNGQQMQMGASKDFTFTNLDTEVTFNFTPETGFPVTIFYHKL